MPLYESQCTKCSKVVEEVRSFEQGVNPRCPDCKSKTMKQIYDGKAPGFLVHGYILGSVRANRGRFQKERRR